MSRRVRTDALEPLEAYGIGSSVAKARSEANLTQKELAERLGVRLWTVDRLEHGADDVTVYLPAIAAVTGHSEGWFSSDRDATRQRLSPAAASAHSVGSDGRGLEPAPAASDHSSRQRRLGRGGRLVLGSLTILVVIRFFTEVVHVLPKATTFIDVPLFVVLVVAASVGYAQIRPADGRAFSFLLPGMLFFAISAVSALVNLGRVAPAPVLVFLYGFLGPLGIYYAVYRLWPVGRALALSRLLVALGLVQFAVVAGIQLPRFVASGNPDLISGTFGANAYQLVFFLIVLAALLCGLATFERDRLAARAAPLMLPAVAVIVFLAQYRALLITTLLSVLLIGAFLAAARGRGFLMGAIVAAAFIGSLLYVANEFPTTKFQTTIATIESDPWFYAKSRLQAADDVISLYSDEPRYIVTGTGPGTYSSRAWRTFADLRSARTAVAAPYAAAINGGQYITDVSEKYVAPRLRSAEIIQGSRALTSPFSSYLSLLAEVGLLGFLALIGTYVLVLVRAGRMTLRAMRTARPSDPLPALLLSCTVAFFTLLQLAALENWLEVTRLTFLSWALLAVVTKEFEARATHDVRTQ